MKGQPFVVLSAARSDRNEVLEKFKDAVKVELEPAASGKPDEREVPVSK